MGGSRQRCLDGWQPIIYGAGCQLVSRIAGTDPSGFVCGSRCRRRVYLYPSSAGIVRADVQKGVYKCCKLIM